MRELIDYLDINEGITTAIGSGGKTSLMKRLSEELAGTVILTTSTHILPFDNMPIYTGSDISELRNLVETERIVCTGTEDGVKLASPSMDFDGMTDAADYVIVEGDGSNRLPLKAHKEFEPVIPYNTNQVILVVGASGWDRKINNAVHRPEIFSAKGTVFSFSGDIVTPEMYADFLVYELQTGILKIPPKSRLKILINQVDTELEMEKSRRFAAEFRRKNSPPNISYVPGIEPIPIIAGSINKSKYELI